MTDKQKRFVEEYLVDLNATQAAIRAGYKPDNATQTSRSRMSRRKRSGKRNGEGMG